MSDAFAPPAQPGVSSELEDVTPGFLPIETRGTVLVWSLGIYLVLGLLSAAMLSSFLLVGENDLGAVIALLWLPILAGVVVSFIVCAVGFCMFGYRANKNLRLWTESEFIVHTPGWAAGWWFVPIANLWKPYQVFSELWILSDPDALDDSPGGGFIGVWWAAWLAGTIINRVSNRIPETMVEATLLTTALGAGAMAIASLLAIRMVRGIMRRQAATARARTRVVEAVGSRW